MILENLHLYNYRGFEELAVPFHSNLSVIVGNNGAGKTTILEAAAIALGTIFTPLDDISGVKINKEDAHRKSFEMGSSDDVQQQYPVEISAKGEIEGRNIQWQRSLNSKNGATTLKDAKELTDIAVSYQQRLRTGDQTLTLPIIAYYGTGRLWDPHREKRTDTFKDNTRTNGYIDSLDGRANIKLMMNWFRNMTIKKYQRQEENLGGVPELDAVYSAMKDCFEAVTGYSNINFQYSMDTKEINVFYSDDSGKRMRIPLNQLSDGYKGTISLIADIAYRMSTLNPHLQDEVLVKTPGVILIDEVDLHLHPTWQQRILRDLVRIFPSVQFIVTTHAPAVINSVQSDNLIILEDNQVNEPIGEVYGKDANAILKGIMGADERPAEIKKLFAEFYDSISDCDLRTAELRIQELEHRIGNDDAELAGCRVKMRLAKVRSGSHD